MTADEYDILVGGDAGSLLASMTPSTAGFDAGRIGGTSGDSVAARPAESGARNRRRDAVLHLTGATLHE